MDDSEIVELFWRRDQRAVDETAARYGAYCRAVAGRVLSPPKMRRSASTTRCTGRGRPSRPSVPALCPPF